jgi:hypothetical protein
MLRLSSLRRLCTAASTSLPDIKRAAQSAFTEALRGHKLEGLQVTDIDFFNYVQEAAHTYGYRAELIEGRVRLYGSAAPFHNRTIQRLGADLDKKYGDSWTILPEQTVYYDTANKWGHNLAGWKQPNNVLRRQTAVYTTEIPHWVCEVLLPGTKWQDVQPSDKPSKRKRVNRLGSKFLTAQKFGVAHYWLVEPDVGWILVFSHDAPGSVGLLHHSLTVESHEPSLHIPPFASVNLQRVFEHLHVKPHKL